MLLANALVIAAVLLWLHGRLLAFEAATPTAALDAYFAQLYAGQLDDIHKNSGFEPGRFDGWEDYDALLYEAFGREGSLSYQKLAQPAEDGGQLYEVYRNGHAAGRLMLRQTDGEWQAALPPPERRSYTVTAPAHAKVTLNGIPLGEADITGQEAISLFGKLAGSYEVPQLVTYRAGPVLGTPALHAEGPDGEACRLAPEDDGAHYAVSMELGDEAALEVRAQAEAAAKAYATFISEDLGFAGLAPHLLPDTDFYRRMEGYVTGWYIEHDSYAFQDLAVAAPVNYSEGCATVEVSFTFRVYRQGPATRDAGEPVQDIEHSFPSHYRMAMVRSAQQWLLAELQVL